MSIDLESPSMEVEPINVVDYPSAGVGDITGCTDTTAITFTNRIIVSSTESSSSSGFEEYFRVNSFSAAKMPNNGAIIAVASQDAGVDHLPLTNDAAELARREASRVHVIWTPLGKYASVKRKAVVTGFSGDRSGDCQVGVVNIHIVNGSEFTEDTNLQYIWVLDGPLAGVKFRVVSQDDSNWVIVPFDTNTQIDLSIDSCFNFVAFGCSEPTYPYSLNAISPLPYIEVDGLAVPACNPQIATNVSSPTGESSYVYVIAEAPVNGTYQLFFYSFMLHQDSEVYQEYAVFGWRQLTFDGENKNARIKCDSTGNLHIVWESVDVCQNKYSTELLVLHPAQ